MFTGEPIGKIGDAEACYRGGDESCAIVGLEAPPRVNRDDLVAIGQLPGFRSLHEGLMSR